MYRQSKDNIYVPESLTASVNLSGRSSVLPPPTPATVPNPAPEPRDEETEFDIMISYCHKDKAFMLRLKDCLTESGFSVWVDLQGIDAGDNFLTQIGQAILSSKVFLPIISPHQINSRYCRDELSLAYISDKPIIPVGLVRMDEVFNMMPTGMRLKLASFDWVPFHHVASDPGTVLLGSDDDFAVAFRALRVAIETAVGAVTERQTSVEPVQDRKSEKPPLRGLSTQQSVDRVPREDFWAKYFADRFDAPWSEFVDLFKEEYAQEIDKNYEQDDLAWLMKNLHRELHVSSDGRLMRSEYITFLQAGAVYSKTFVNPASRNVSFIDRVNEYAIETFAVREVFRIESSVRVDAIENLGKFRSMAVMEALLDLLNDEDPNVRAVALISLAKTGNNSNRTIKSICECLKDHDRLVREAACLALGRLQFADNEELVVSEILKMWRNDVISTVRDSAELALQQLDSEPARVAIKMTKILQKEIKLLKD